MPIADTGRQRAASNPVNHHNLPPTRVSRFTDPAIRWRLVRERGDSLKRVASGHFGLPLSAKAAIAFFTPEGERDWVPGWNPVYPGGQPSEIPGTVFTTDVGGVDTIWLVQEIDRANCRAAYVRVTPGRHAGIVRVGCSDGSDGSCRVDVTYEMSLLPGADPRVLDTYDEGPFQAMMDEWATEVIGIL